MNFGPKETYHATCRGITKSVGKTNASEVTTGGNANAALVARGAKCSWTSLETTYLYKSMLQSSRFQ